MSDFFSGAGGAIIGAGLGMAGSALGIGNKQQRKQQNRLNEDAMAINDKYSAIAEQRAYNRQKEMYERTYQDESPEAKRKQLEDAGLSVGLMYGGSGGMGGAGQASSMAIGNTSGANPGTASTGAQNQAALTQSMAMGLSLARQKAEIENIQADTKLKDTDAGVKEVTAPNIEADTQLKFQYIDNEKLKGEAIKLSNQYQKVQNEIMEATSLDQIEKVQIEVNKAAWEQQTVIENMKQAKMETTRQKETLQTFIDQNKATLNYTQANIYKTLTEADKNKVDAMLAPIKTIIDSGNLETRKDELKELIRNNRAKIQQGYINKAAEEFVKLSLGTAKNTIDLIDAIIPF